MSRKQLQEPLIPYAGQDAVFEELLPKPSEDAIAREILERENADLREQLRHQAQALGAAARLLAPYAAKLNGSSRR
jgi:hypothetical protein